MIPTVIIGTYSWQKLKYFHCILYYNNCYIVGRYNSKVDEVDSIMFNYYEKRNCCPQKNGGQSAIQYKK